MGDEDKTLLAQQLRQRLNLPEEAELLPLLTAVEEAALEASAYLGYLTEPLPEVFYPKVLALAAVFARRERQEQEAAGLKSASYSEGDVSRSESYRTAEEWQDQVKNILSSLAPYRRVRA